MSTMQSQLSRNVTYRQISGARSKSTQNAQSMVAVQGKNAVRSVSRNSLPVKVKYMAIRNHQAAHGGMIGKKKAGCSSKSIVQEFGIDS
ncbi:hypothetical protein TNCV_2002141 [Trichonephila clavipes]|nr:hypothetical protein TNCV_2002141 [Trichonephila clavipes]